jgi:hypothetical protein
MKKAFYFLLGISLIILTSAGTVSVMTVIPAQPKFFIVKTFVYKQDSEEIGIFIKEQMRKGWILKEVEGANDEQSASTWLVVMEKY